ncbi:MAG: hypothetical protein Q9191_001156 [Dirinaria sp. TL-2023a]
MEKQDPPTSSASPPGVEEDIRPESPKETLSAQNVNVDLNNLTSSASSPEPKDETRAESPKETPTPQPVNVTDTAEEEYEYVTGFALVTVIACVTLVAFLMMLDQSIIATPIVAVQNNIPPANLSVAMAVLIFCQTFGGSLFLAISQTAFTNSLSSALDTFAPNIDVNTLLVAGASAIRQVVPRQSLHGVLLAYNQSLNHVFYIAAGTAVASFVFCWGMGWKNVKKAKKDTPEA